MYSRYKRASITPGSEASIVKPASDLAIKAAKLFIESLKKKEAPDKAARHLGNTTKEDIMKWVDDKELDLLHHTIILNNPEAVQYLLTHGYFQAPFEPRTNQYAHLACFLGHRTVLNIILQHRKDDNRGSKKLSYCPNGNPATERRREIWPVDVAAEAGHLPCVKQILDQIIIKENPDYAKYPYVALACVPGSVLSLQLIMKKDKPKEPDIKKAIELSLRSANAPCLDILLKEKIKTDGMFDKVNFFHMLYTFSGASAFSSQGGGYRRLPEVTQVLVKHKHNVNAKNPPNTYPLYSLVKNSLCIHDYTNTRHYIMCMRILLEEGADPNFDEVEHEVKQNQKGLKTVHGRHAYSSAMHCLLETLEFFAEYLESKALGVRFITQMADVLLQNHGKINSIGRIGDKTSKMYGTVLHQFAKSSVKLGVDNDVFKFLLRQGADPNAKWDGRYVINTYFDTLFPSLKEINIHVKAPDYTEEVQRMLGLSLYMNRSCVRETLEIFKETWSKATNPQVKKYIKIAIRELEARIKEVWPLKRLCRTLIWDLCSRDASKVHKLPTDIESRTYILPLV